MFLVPLAFTPHLVREPYNVPKLGLLIVGTALALAVRMVEALSGRSLRSLRPLAVPCAALAIPVVVSWLASPLRDFATLGAYSRFQGLVPQLVLIAFGLLLAEAFAGRPRALAWLLAASAGVVGLYSFVQMLGVDPLRLTSFAGGESATTATIGNPDFAGAFLAIALPVSLGLWVRGQSRTRGLVAAGLTVVIAEGLMLSISQGAWAAAVAGVGVTVGLLVRHRRFWFKAAVAVAIASAASMVVVVLAGMFVHEGLLSAQSGRADTWREAAAMGADSPAIGWGPNTFALQGIHYRVAEDALVSGVWYADDPHSAPMSWFSGEGLLGVAGYLTVAGWVLLRMRRSAEGGPESAAFAGAAVAYFVQGWVSIDEPTLRFASWVALAGLAAGVTRENASMSHRSSGETSVVGRVARASVAVALVAAVGLCAWWTAGFVVADHRVEQAVHLFRRGRIGEGSRQFETALSFRFDPRYQALYGEQLGLASLNRGEAGDELSARMQEQFGYLRETTDIRGMVTYALLLKARTSFEPRLFPTAVREFERIVELDPHNPVVRVGWADTLLIKGRPRGAIDVLTPLADEVGDRNPEFWGTLALAYVDSGDTRSALPYLARSQELSKNNCAALITSELMKGKTSEAVESPSLSDGLTLHFACDPASYEMFLGLLPPRARKAWA